MKPPIIGMTGGSALNQDQIEIVDALKEALAMALEGQIHTMGIVLCLEDGSATLMGGRNAAALNIGVDHLKAKILSATFDAGAKVVEKANVSKIIKPRH